MALFVLVSVLDSPPSAVPTFPLLLVKSPVPALTRLVTSYLSTRHDALLHPLRIAPASMLHLAEQLVLHRDTSLEADLATDEMRLATNLTFAFPPAIAREGLSTVTLTLPPALLAPLCTLGAGGFVAGLAAHVERVTAIPLDRLALVRIGAGRGTMLQLVLLAALSLFSTLALAAAPVAAPYRAYPLPSSAPAWFPAALRETVAGDLVFDRRAFDETEGKREVCFREVFGGAASFTVDLSTFLSLTDAAGTPFHLSTGQKTTLNLSRVAYVQGCYPTSVWGLLRGESGVVVDAGSAGAVGGSVARDRTVQQASGLRAGEVEGLLDAGWSNDGAAAA
ncbi:hypothetical protein JCM3770_003703 [Rhodotorula araucariae]